MATSKKRKASAKGKASAKKAPKAKPAKAKKAKAKPAKAKPAKAKSAKAKPPKMKARKAAPKPKAPAARPAPPPVPSADEAMRALARRIVEVTTANDDEATYALYAADVESTEMGQPPTVGIDALRQKFAGWRNMVTESHFEPRRICVDGNTIVIEWLGKVTLAGSGNQVEMHEVAIHEIRDGKIAREAYFYNPGALAG